MVEQQDARLDAVFHALGDATRRRMLRRLSEGELTVGQLVSALVNGYLFVVPVIEKWLGTLPRPKPTVLARLTVNLSSQAGREDWWPVNIVVNRQSSIVKYEADPIFGKSNLIFTLANADGLLRIAPEATGLSAGEMAGVMLL